MRRKFKNQITITSFTLILLIVCLFSSTEWLKSSLSLIYAAQYLMIFCFVFQEYDRWRYIFSPSFVIVSYISVSNIIGSYAFHLGYVASKIDLADYLDWQHTGAVASFFLLANLVTILAYYRFSKNDSAPLVTTKPKRLGRNFGSLFFISFCSVVIFTIFSWLDFNLAFLGGEGSFNTFPKAIAMLSLVIVIAGMQLRGRSLIYILLIAYFCSFSSNDKREALFLLPPISLIECVRARQFRFNLKILRNTAIVGSLFLSLVITMSIYRGYGEYDPKNFFDSFNYVDDYVADERFIEYIGNNLETNYMFFHSHQAIEYVMESTELLTFGSTFLKVIYAPIPRRIFRNKPQGIIHLYTDYHSPALRSLGGSWVASMFAEFFWAFHFFGLLPLFWAVYFLDYWYARLFAGLKGGIDFKHLFGLFAYLQMFELIRGSGSDYFFISLGIGAAIIYIFFWPIIMVARVIEQHSTQRIFSNLSSSAHYKLQHHTK